MRRIDPSELIDPKAVRPAGGCVIEMHAHSSERSLDSGVRAEVLVAQAASRGLDGICLTEHNAIWPAEQARELEERHGVRVFPAMELGTDIGHILVYGLSAYAHEMLRFRRLREIIDAEGAAMVFAHPMRHYAGAGTPPGWDEWPDWFEGIEAINGDHSDSVDGYLVRVAASLGIAALGGSDAHSRQAVGRAATAFFDPVSDVHELAARIRERRIAPVDLRPAAPRLVE